jgi:hypothetical protein
MSFLIKQLFFKKNLRKNWPNDPKVGCKLTSNLVESIQTNLGSEEELEKIEGSFERDEIVNI